MASGGAGVTDAEGGREEYPMEWNLRDSSPLLEVVNLVGVKYKGRGEKSKCTPDRHRSRFARRTQQPSLLSFFFFYPFLFFLSFFSLSPPLSHLSPISERSASFVCHLLATYVN